MRPRFLLSLVVTSACASAPPRVEPATEIPIDEAFLATHLSWSFSAPTTKCYAALVETFEDPGIERQDPEAGEVVSAKRTFPVNATYTTRGTDTSTTFTNNPDGTISTSKTTTPTTSVDRVQLEQSTQYFFRVDGDERECTIAAFRWRAWNGEVEMKALQAEGVKWAETNLFAPLRDEILRRISAPDEPDGS